MEPSIRQGSVVWVNRLSYFFTKPKKNDVVAFDFQGKTLIKRVESLKGDLVYLKGDNQTDSLDSSVFGTIHRKQIVGKII